MNFEGFLWLSLTVVISYAMGLAITFCFFGLTVVIIYAMGLALSLYNFLLSSQRKKERNKNARPNKMDI